jgi:hypothetical protein
MSAGAAYRATATIEWGTMMDDGVPDNERAKSRETTFSEPLDSRWGSAVGLGLGAYT